MKNLLNKLFVFSSNNGWYESYQNHRTSGSCSCRGYCPRNSDLLQVRGDVTATSFPTFSPTRSYGARERERDAGKRWSHDSRTELFLREEFFVSHSFVWFIRGVHAVIATAR